MKKLFIFLLILQILTFPSLSHPGRTDSNGGHWNRETGEYHYHSGEYAGRTQNSSSVKEQSHSYIPPKKEIEIEIIEPTDTYYAGKTYIFSAKLPKGYSQSDVNWTIDDENIGTFDGSALTLKKSGYIQITATLEDAEAYYSFSVQEFKIISTLENVALYALTIGFVFWIICLILSIFTKRGSETSASFLPYVYLSTWIIPILCYISCGIIMLYYKFFWLK